MTRFIFILLLSPIMLFSQAYKDTFEVVNVQPSQKFYLSSGGRSWVGGQSRVTIPINLPENTVQWYYTLTTINAKTKTAEKEQEADNVAGKLKLTQQLAGLVEKGAKVASNFNLATLAVSLATTPSGGEMCDVYLLNQENSQKFLAKADQSLMGKGFSYEPEGTREQFNSGNVPVKNIISGNWFLGIKNPTALTGMYVTLEVAAVVKKKVKVEISEEAQKARIYLNLADQQYKNASYDKCIEYCKKAIELNPKNPFPHFKVGLCKILQSKSVDAIDDYVTGISLAAKKPEAARRVLNFALIELNKAQAQNQTIQGFDDVKQLLDDEMKKYPNTSPNSNTNTNN